MTLAASDISPLQVDGSMMTTWYHFLGDHFLGDHFLGDHFLCALVWKSLPCGQDIAILIPVPLVVVARVTLVVFGDVASSIPRVMGSPFANTNLLLWAPAQKICRNDHCPSGLPARPGGSVLKC